MKKNTDNYSMNRKGKKELPSMPLYIGDWKKEPAVQAMDAADEGIFLRLIMICWESEKRGYLQLNNKPIPHNLLAKMLKLDNQRLTEWLTTYQGTFKIFGETEDGILYSRKHIKLIELSEKRKQAGKLGGNPDLINKDSKVNQALTNRLTKKQDFGYSNAENENEIETEDESENEKETEVVTGFERKCLDFWVERAKKHFRTVKVDETEFLHDIRAVINDGLKPEELEVIQDFLREPKDSGEFDWFPQIGTPGKLRERSKKSKQKYWEMVLRDSRNLKSSVSNMPRMQAVLDETLRRYGPRPKEQTDDS